MLRAGIDGVALRVRVLAIIVFQKVIMKICLKALFLILIRDCVGDISEHVESIESIEDGETLDGASYVAKTLH